MTRDRKLEDVLNEIDKLFGDTSVPVEKTRERMREIIEHTEGCIETLPDEDE